MWREVRAAPSYGVPTEGSVVGGVDEGEDSVAYGRARRSCSSITVTRVG